jgi:hypothetical protein
MDALSTDQQRYLEKYVAALQDMQLKFTGSAFDMRNGSRCHPVRDYRNMEEIKKLS